MAGPQSLTRVRDSRQQCVLCLSGAKVGCWQTTGAYAECNAPYVRYGELPDDLAAEVDAAFDEGEYVTDALQYEGAVGDGTPLWWNDDPYEHRIEVDGEKRRLSFDRITAYDSPLTLELLNETDEPVSVSVTITDEDGECAVDAADRTVEADDRERLEAVSEFGTYEVDVELADGRSTTSTWEVFPPKSEGLDGLVVSIGDDVSIKPLGGPTSSCPVRWCGTGSEDVDSGGVTAAGTVDCFAGDNAAVVGGLAPFEGTGGRDRNPV